MENNLRQNMLEECCAMIQFLSAYGKDIPKESSSIINSQLTELKLVELSGGDLLKLHILLSK